MLYALPLLILLCVCLPALALLGLRQSLAAVDHVGEPLQISLKAYLLQIAVLQSLVVGLAGLAAVKQNIPFIQMGEFSVATLLLALAVLLALIGVSLIESRRSLASQDCVRAQLREVSPSNPAWVGISIYAGVVEEIAYRGVLVMVLAEPLGYWPAAVVSAFAFALAHVSSGWRAVPLGLIFALAMQLVVFISGGLLLAIAIHIAYDLCVAWLGHRLREHANN